MDDDEVWPDYLPSDWVDEPAPPIDPVSVVVGGIVVVMILFAAVLFVRV
jgi:preprotein translocase subunit Sec61beta